MSPSGDHQAELDLAGYKTVVTRLEAACHRAEENLRASATRFGLIIETQRDVAAAELDLESVMHLICRRTQQVTRAGAAEIILIEGDELVLGAGSGFTKTKPGERVGIEGTLTGWAFRNG